MPTTLFLRKIGRGVFQVDDAHSEEQSEKWQVGEIVKMDASRPRNINHHRWLMALIGYVVHNTDRFIDHNRALTQLKLDTGHYDEYIVMEGGKQFAVRVPKSIAFNSMDEDEFMRFADKAVDAICEYMDAEPDDVRRGIDEFLR